MTERIEWVTDRGRFDALRPRWDLLAREPFQRHGWFTAWWESFAASRELAVCTLWREEELVGVVPLCRRLGSLEVMANVHSPLFEPLSKDPTALDRVLRASVAGARGRLTLAPVPSEGPVFERCVAAVREVGRVVWIEPGEVSPIADTSGEYAAYREPRRRSWRELERRRRRLLREHSPIVRLIERPADVERELSRGFALEARGWKGRNGTAILSAEQTRRFYTAAARTFHASGEFVVSSIEVDGCLLAWDLAILEGERYWLLKTAFDERHRSLAPGLVLRHQVIEHCFERGLRAHEFLGDAMDWKLPFATGQRAHAAIRAYRWRPAPILSYAYRRFARPPAARAYHRLIPPRSARSRARSETASRE